jgi:AsmA protein
LIRSIIAIIVLVGLVLASARIIPANQVARSAADTFTANRGRGMTTEGPLRPTFWPDLGVTTGPSTIVIADWSDQGPMVWAKGLDIKLDLAILIRGTVKITGISMAEPRVIVQRARDGRENWVFGAGGG